MNIFGSLFRVITFGESHGPAMGVVIDGCPAGLKFDNDLIQNFLDKRRPGQSNITSDRNELDEFKVLSGVYNDITLGTPIAMIVENKDQRSQDYNKIQNQPRVGHADDLWKGKYLHSDPRGGGRSSGRETLSRVLAGAVAKMLSNSLIPNLQVAAFVSSIGPLEMSNELVNDKFADQNLNSLIESSPVRIPCPQTSELATQLLLKAKSEGLSYGSNVVLSISNLPPHLGQPVFRKIKSDLAQALMSIGASIAFEIGAGFDSSKIEGTKFHSHLQSDVYGGIRGGLSTGEPIFVKVGFKPTSSVLDVAKQGRHDPCIGPRAVAVVESMAWLVIIEHLLWSKLDHI